MPGIAVSRDAAGYASRPTAQTQKHKYGSCYVLDDFAHWRMGASKLDERDERPRVLTNWLIPHHHPGL